MNQSINEPIPQAIQEWTYSTPNQQPREMRHPISQCTFSAAFNVSPLLRSQQGRSAFTLSSHPSHQVPGGHRQFTTEPANTATATWLSVRDAYDMPGTLLSTPRPFHSNRSHSSPLRWTCVCSVVSDSLWPHGLQPVRLLCPWGFSRQEYWSLRGDLPHPGIEPMSLVSLFSFCPQSFPASGTFPVNQLFPSFQFSSVAQSCPVLCDPMDCSTPGFPVHHQLLNSCPSSRWCNPTILCCSGQWQWQIIPYPILSLWNTVGILVL